MADLTDSNSTSVRDNALVEIVGADGTSIGNVTDSVKTNVTNASGASAVNIQDGGNSITVDATSLPLPTGASTSSLQTTGNSSLSSIDTKTPSLGQALAAGSTPVVLTAAQIITLTPLTSVTVTQATGTNLHTVIDSSALPTGAATEATLAKLPLAQGSTTSGQSGVLEQGAVTTAAPTYTTGQTSPLSLTTVGALRTDSSATTQPISATSLPLPTGASTSTLQTTGNASLSSIDTKTPALGQALAAASTPVVLTAAQITTLTPLTSITVTQATGTNLHAVIDSSALPTGAATEATLANLNLSQGSTTSGQSGPLIQGAVTTNNPSYTTAQTNPLSLDTAGNLRVVSTSITKSTYGAAISGLVIASLATDIVTVTGSASKTIKIQNIEISGTTTAGAGASVSATLVKRSTADTGGTSTTPTAVAYDSTNSAATATFRAYTVNPTSLGTAVGSIRATRLVLAQVGTAGQPITWAFDGNYSQFPTLRGTSEQLCINFNTTTITGPVISISIEWSEE